MKIRVSRLVRIFVLLAPVLMLPGILAAQQSVLVLNSYHDGYAWSDSLVEGITSVLAEHHVRIRVEYMDTKYLDPILHDEVLRDFYARKYGDTQPDVIIATDINAKFFLARHHDDLFPEVPVVLAGAHDFRATAPEGSWWTGVYAELPAKETLDLALALQTEISHVLVIAEQTSIGRAIGQEVGDEAALHPGGPIVTIAVDNEMERLIAATRELPADSVVIYTLVSHDAAGRFVPPEESLGRLVREVDVPVYTILDVYAGMGVVGGVLLEGGTIGRAAANLAVRLLNGEPVEDVPLVGIEPDKVICDWSQLERFGIPESRVPDGATIINAPSSTVEIPRGVVAITIAGIILLASVAIVFVRLSHRQRRTQALLEEHRRQIERSLRAESSLAELASYLNQLEDASEFSADKISNYLRRVMDTDAVTVSICTDVDAPEDCLAASIAMDYGEASQISGSIADLPDELREQMAESGYRSFVVSSLTAEHASFGEVLYVRDDADEWTSEEMDLLSTVTSMLAATRDRFEAASARLAAERRDQEARAMLERSGRLASIGVMAAGITHEISQPLNYIRMTADGLLRIAPPEKSDLVPVTQRKLSRIAEAVNRITRVVTHMRECWAVPPDNAGTSADLCAALASALALIREQLARHGIELIMEIPSGPVMVSSSTVSIEQIVVNLVGNAISALEDSEDRQISISLHATDWAELRVEDSGSGICEEDLASIFDPFYTSRRDREGMGLGLAIVKALVERDGGTISAYNNDRGGAGFLIRFLHDEMKVIQ